MGVGVTLARKFRPNSQSLLARLGFVCSVGSGDKRQESQHKEETLGPQARSRTLAIFLAYCNLTTFLSLLFQESTQAWCPKAPLEDLFSRRLRDGGFVRVRLHLQEGHALTEFFTVPCPPNPAPPDQTFDQV